jgi:hypothetical protein
MQSETGLIELTMHESWKWKEIPAHTECFDEKPKGQPISVLKRRNTQRWNKQLLV